MGETSVSGIPVGFIYYRTWVRFKLRNIFNRKTAVCSLLVSRPSVENTVASDGEGGGERHFQF